MIRLAPLLLSVVAISSIGGTAAQVSRPSGFELPAIQGGYPGKTFQFDGPQSKQLAREVLPVVMDDVTRASVSESITLPVGAYDGLTIDFALNVGVDYTNTICEERHAIVVFRYSGASADVRDMRPVLKDGAIADHAFAGLGWNNRYFTLPAKAASHNEALAKCRSLANDTSHWRQAPGLIEYIEEQRRLSAFDKALETLPMAQIRCLGPQGKRCAYDRSKLVSIVRATPPEQSGSIIVPTEGAVSVFRHYGYNDAARMDYVATLRASEADHPTSLEIRFSESSPPPVV